MIYLKKVAAAKNAGYSVILYKDQGYYWETDTGEYSEEYFDTQEEAWTDAYENYLRD